MPDVEVGAEAIPPPTEEEKTIPEISRDFEEGCDSSKSIEKSESSEPASQEDVKAYNRYENVGAWRTLEQRREIVLYRKKTGQWPEEVSRETGLQSYYEIRYFSTQKEHKTKYAKQHALARQWWEEYKTQASKGTSEVDTDEPPRNVVPLRQRKDGHR